ncbi:hypothetical protein LL912_22180 [Niabella sp. CC-SYL272]|uniref:hypothetical protein n=1 Tax=Niabella agricola TaxID=2891571 RepID=UPI001F21E187|nr:hypothetical protein [Niabella agricola]MCF3111511.1 hypothetical protein [Niabella agricola]
MTDDIAGEDFNRRQQLAETVAEIAPNRTLIAGLLTAQAPLKPEAVYGLQNLEMVFAHYQPELAVALEAATGGIVKETLRFCGLEDFAPSQIGIRSGVLRESRFQSTVYLNAVRMLRSNASLRQVLVSKEKRSDMHTAIKKIMVLLEQYL